MRAIIFLFLIFGAVFGDTKPRIIALDWSVAEILEFLEVEPIAMAEKQSFMLWGGGLGSGANTLDLGLRNQPSLEMIIALKPDFVLLPSFFAGHEKTISKYAKTRIIDVYKDGNLEDNLNAAVLEVAKILDCEERAKILLAKNNEFFEKKKKELENFATPVLVVQFIDAAHIRIYGANSLYGVVLSKLGVQNLAPSNLSYNLWGIASAHVSALYEVVQGAKLVIIEPNRVDINSQIASNGIYKNLQILQNRAQIEAVWSAGAWLSMQKFANLLSEILKNEANLANSKISQNLEISPNLANLSNSPNSKISQKSANE
ncbi:ABC transporter substrate-binding protein [Campylobacter sp. JMF_02 ED1]|uniref:ABC transporter substrate-binding protein n=1 Tax=unclassified Campylobacter TaxID=2593542 RepID=UPI0022E9B52C|nr:MULTISPECIES: ABC transporter substrate-binding protein [unclassified Campylobacter]MDA3049358.1 ABC transporter substrate-binding protein [Campylobacter sp. JMF_15 NE4]MDA3051214.1 ABC transporter substrate-binding protein [Campylobacter sp. JMF_02 ED1]